MSLKNKQRKNKETIYEESPILNGLFVMRRSISYLKLPDVKEPVKMRGGSGYRLNKKIFNLFVDEYKNYLRIRRRLLARKSKKKKVESQKYKRGLIKFIPVSGLFEKQWRWVIDEIVVRVESPWGRVYPFINPIYFPRAGGAKEFWTFYDLVATDYGYLKGQSRGAGQGSRTISPAQGKKYESLKKKGYSDIRISEKTHSKEYKDDTSDPLRKMKSRFSRYRKIIKRNSLTK